MKQANLILHVPPRSHFEANIFETDHLEERELVDHPTQSWKVDGDVVDEDGPDHPDVEVVEGVVLSELAQGVDASNVDGEMTRGDGVGSAAFLLEIPLVSQSVDLTRTLVLILLMDGDGNRKDSSIFDPLNRGKRDHHLIQRPAVSDPVLLSRNLRSETNHKKIASK